MPESRFPDRPSGPLDEEALRVVRRALGDVGGPARARYLARPGTKKNIAIAYESRGERFVLKLYRQDLRYAAGAVKNPFPRYGSRAFTLRSLATTRLRAELDGIAGFREAGLETFEVVARPLRNALVFRYEEGSTLRDVLRAEPEPARRRHLVSRLARDLAQRQRTAAARNDLRMIHPAPRVHHAWVRPGGAFAYYDFEDRVNPSLRVAEALAHEVESFFYHLMRLRVTADASTVAAARDALGEEPWERWREERARRPLWWLSGSARRRRQTWEEVRRCGPVASLGAVRESVTSGSVITST